MQADTTITLERIEGYIAGFWWILPNLGIALVVGGLFLIAASLARRAVLRVFKRRARPDLAVMLAGAVRWAIIGLGLLVVATIVFPSVSPANLLSTLGIGSIAIGFAFKDILQNWLAGLLILLRQPFRPGDQIVVGTHEGTVEHIEARATLIKTYDGCRVIIPNSAVYTDAVTVNTAFPLRRSQYDVGIGYSDDIDHACDVILAAIRNVEGVAEDPAPEAFAWEIASSSINIRVRWWTHSKRSEVVRTQGRVVRAMKRALTEAEIDLPFSTNVVLLHDQTDEADGDRRRQREGWPAGDEPPAPRHLNEVVVEGEADRSRPEGRPPSRRRS
ncbi:mechanosensitive ion channel family protein [Microvirga splendida]|uniref:Small-conductance mechanosensitive channel n=1 Tax=Microvirga splendida TaxID=2795727 RepID=A0ABS0Y882_9HYPH|nr:mechanosensitive ion channel family protein [Microvirga splendida]MBJ6128503.1 mechanosensitive ion channel family protein [Microvirga splendida]